MSFGNRTASIPGNQDKQISTLLPEDFGSPGYGGRRKDTIDAHIASLAQSRGELLEKFDYWIKPSTELRQYLWAHEADDLERARRIINILPVEIIQRILRYLVSHYWGHYLGWPDLLVYRQNEFFFVEVKSSKDKLSEEQKSWIRGNRSELNLPFKLAKIHKRSIVEAPQDSE